MFSKVFFLCFVALAASQSITGLYGLGGDLTGVGLGTNDWVLNDIGDQQVLKDLIRLDVVNRPLVIRLLQLDVVERKIVGDLCRAINHVIIKKGTIYPLTLWDRVLKIKGTGVWGVFNRGIENNWVETEIEDKQILEDLIKIDTIDRHIVTSLLWLDVVDRKIVADVVEVINHKVLTKGPIYAHVLLKQLMRINGGIVTPFNSMVGHTGYLWGGRGLVNPIWRGIY